MSSHWLTIEQVARILSLQARTIRGYVRSGALKATRIGRQYRIARADLEAFTGAFEGTQDAAAPGGAMPGRAAPERFTQVEVAGVVRIEGISRDTADRLTRLLNTAPGRPDGPPLQLNATYEPGRDCLRILIAADLAGGLDALAMIHAFTDGPVLNPA